MDVSLKSAGSIARASRPTWIRWLRENLFKSWWSTALTLVLGYFIVRWAVGLIDWAVINAVWSVPADANGKLDSTLCHEAAPAGACWAAIADKYRFILFGRYPYDQQWRPAICVGLFVALFVVSSMRFFWRRELILIWIGALTLVGTLMWGGVLGLSYVSENEWGGLPITLILATFGLALAFPVAVAAALGRRSESLPLVRMICVTYIELIRGVPLISLLFMASVLFPLFMPAGMDVNKLIRVQMAITLFAGAYLAEVIRGGLQALPKGQYEAADALGLSYWKKTFLIVLPQALKMVIPPLVNTFIGFFKDTSLVMIVGVYDLLTAGKAATYDPTWNGFSTEIYVMIACVYFVFCFAMSKYSRGLERRLSRSDAR